MARLAVIGGGLAGLAAAGVLAGRGHSVTLIEARGVVGGKLHSLDAGNARIDLGPTILTDLEPLIVLMRELGGLSACDVVLERPDPQLLLTFRGGGRLVLHRDAARTEASVRALGPDAVHDWQRILDLGARAERLSAHFYRRGDVSSARDLLVFALAGGAGLADVVPFARHASLARLLEASTRSEPVRRFVAHCARFLGQDAARSPAVALVIAHGLIARGIWYPLGGTTRLAETVARLGVRAGASVMTGETVEGLELSGGAIRGAFTSSGRRVAADAFVSTVDVAQTARWLPGSALARRSAHLRPTLTARVAWWVIEGGASSVAHHAIHFGDGGDEPLYVATPTVTDRSLAPAGVSVLYALVHGAAGERATTALARAMRERIEAAGQWPQGREVASGVSGTGQSCYGYEIGPGLFSSFRPSQRVREARNLFLAGGSVFPGPGLANVIRSALRAARLAEAAVEGRTA